MKTEIIVKPDSDLIKTLKKALESEFNIKVERADVRILVSGKREDLEKFVKVARIRTNNRCSHEIINKKGDDGE